MHSSQDSDIITVRTAREITIRTERGQFVQQEGGTVFKAEIHTGRTVPVGMIPEADYHVFIAAV